MFETNLEAANKIISKFQNKSELFLFSQMQGGKTRTYGYVIQKWMQDGQLTSTKRDFVVLTGVASLDLKQQISNDLVSMGCAAKGKVLHSQDLNQSYVNDMINKDAELLVVIDESHYAESIRNKPFKFVEAIRAKAKACKLLFVTATPSAALSKLEEHNSSITGKYVSRELTESAKDVCCVVELPFSVEKEKDSDKVKTICEENGFMVSLSTIRWAKSNKDVAKRLPAALAKYEAGGTYHQGSDAAACMVSLDGMLLFMSKRGTRDNSSTKLKIDTLTAKRDTTYKASDFVMLAVTPEYRSVDQLLQSRRVQDINLLLDVPVAIAKHIKSEIKLRKQFYTIVRMRDKAKIKTIQKHLYGMKVDYKYINYESDNIDLSFLSIEPKEAVIVFIKNSARLGTQMDTKFVASVWDTQTKNTTTETVVQSLAGRCCGYGKTGHDLTVFTNLDECEVYSNEIKELCLKLKE